MAYTSAEARQDLLDGFAEAIDGIGLALAALGAAYEQLDEHNADRLEEELFGPVQRAYGRAKSTYAQFAGRHGMVVRAFEAPAPGLPSTGAKGFIDNAVAAVAEADGALSALQGTNVQTVFGPFAIVLRLPQIGWAALGSKGAVWSGSQSPAFIGFSLNPFLATVSAYIGASSDSRCVRR